MDMQSKAKKLIEIIQTASVEWKPLGEVASYIRGLTYNKGDESPNNSGYKVLRANNITLSNRDLCKKALPSTAETQTQVFGCFRPQSLLILPQYPLILPGYPIIRHPGRLLGGNRHT